MYKEDPRVWNAIFDRVAADFQQMELNGIELTGQGVVFPIILGNKGDWSYLAANLFLDIRFHFILPLFTCVACNHIKNQKFEWRYLYCILKIIPTINERHLRYHLRTWSALTGGHQKEPKKVEKMEVVGEVAFAIFACVAALGIGKPCSLIFENQKWPEKLWITLSYFSCRHFSNRCCMCMNACSTLYIQSCVHTIHQYIYIYINYPAALVIYIYIYSISQW